MDSIKAHFRWCLEIDFYTTSWKHIYSDSQDFLKFWIQNFANFGLTKNTITGTISFQNTPLFSGYQLRKENSDSTVSRALEEALRTSTILGWDIVEHSNSPIMTSTTSVANNNTIDLMSSRDLMSSVRFTSVNKSVSSRSTPVTAHSSPKAAGLRGKKSFSCFLIKGQ